MPKTIYAVNFSKFKTTEAAQKALNKMLPSGTPLKEAKAFLRASKVVCKDAMQSFDNHIRYIECFIQYPLNTTGRVNYFIALQPFQDLDKNHLLQQADITRHTTFL